MKKSASKTRKGQKHAKRMIKENYFFPIQNLKKTIHSLSKAYGPSSNMYLKVLLDCQNHLSQEYSGSKKPKKPGKGVTDAK